MKSAAPYRFGPAWTKALARIRRMRSVILGYHGVANCARRDDQFALQLAPERFRAQLEMMLDAGFRFVTVADFAARAGDGTPPPGLAAVSFDDGLRNNLTTAAPILRELGIPATVYVATSLLGEHSPWLGPGGSGAMLSHDELRELADEGWEIGAHTVTHADLSLLDYDACRSEIGDSKEMVESIVGAPVVTLAYPWGRYGSAAVAAARDAGLLAAVATGSGSWNRYELTRAMIGTADPWPILLLKLTDRFEPLVSRPPLSVIQRAASNLRR